MGLKQYGFEVLCDSEAESETSFAKTYILKKILEEWLYSGLAPISIYESALRACRLFFTTNKRKEVIFIGHINSKQKFLLKLFLFPHVDFALFVYICKLTLLDFEGEGEGEGEKREKNTERTMNERMNE